MSIHVSQMVIRTSAQNLMDTIRILLYNFKKIFMIFCYVLTLLIIEGISFCQIAIRTFDQNTMATYS